MQQTDTIISVTGPIGNIFLRVQAGLGNFKPIPRQVLERLLYCLLLLKSLSQVKVLPILGGPQDER